MSVLRDKLNRKDQDAKFADDPNQSELEEIQRDLQENINVEFKNSCQLSYTSVNPAAHKPQKAKTPADIIIDSPFDVHQSDSDLPSSNDLELKQELENINKEQDRLV